jgi:chemotaxis protein MotB
VKTRPGEVDIELASTSFFSAGSAQLKREAVPVLEHVLAQIKPFLAASDMVVKIEGHTDDTPSVSKQFPSNWELSTARASNVVRFFIAKGIPANRLMVTGYADTKPKVANRDATGKAIPENQLLNRRVVITLSRKQ